MKQFLAFVIKEFHHILRDRRTILILLIMPIIQIILFGFAVTTEVKNVRVSILDHSKDDITQNIIQQINANEYLSISEYIYTTDEIDEIFRKNKTDLVLIFSDHFDNDLRHSGQASVQIIADGTDPNMATMYVTYLTNILLSAQQNLNSGKILSGKFSIQPVVKLLASVAPATRVLYNPQMKSSYNFVPGIMGLIFILICAMMTSISIVREKETGTMEVLLVSPVKPIFIIFAKMIPYFALSCINLTSILLLSVYVLDVPITGNVFSLIFISLLFIIVSLSLGLLISTVTQTQVAAMLASGMVLIMPIMVLSGMMFPIESMPHILQTISCILPARWYIISIKKIMIEGLSIFMVWKEVCILFSMGIILIIISLKKFNNRLE